MEYRQRGIASIPPIVKNLIIINVLVFLATIVFGRMNIDISEYLALYNWQSEKFKLWQIFTHMFMHGDVGGPNADIEAGFMHLFSNMFALWMFGAVLENYWGSQRFLIFYLLCGMGAAMLYMGVVGYEIHIAKEYLNEFVLNPTYKQFSTYLSQNHFSSDGSPGRELFQFKAAWADNPSSDSFANQAKSYISQIYNLKLNQGTVGASGAVFGILFAVGYTFPNTEVFVLFIVMKMKYFVAIYAAMELYLGLKNMQGDNVAHFAHLGGMVIAFILIKIWNKTNRKSLY